jgi:endonuclease/exonuclease/phosphatase (EEP) superfamily protein YafD
VRVARIVLCAAAVSCLVPALSLTIVRPTDTTIGPVVRWQALAPMGIPLYAAALVLALGAILVERGWRRRTLVAMTLVAVLGLGVHLWWFAPQVVGSSPAAAAGAPTLTIMNSNIYGNHGDPVQLVEAASREHVDVLVVEEVTEWAVARMDEAGLAELLPHRIGTYGDGVSGTMVFSREPLGEPERLATEFECWRVQLGDLTLIAVHPVAPISPTSPDQWREEHHTILAAAEAAHADLVVGDLNASADHAVIRDLSDAGYRDAAELDNAGWLPTWPANHAGIIPWLPPVVRLDHVLVGPELTAHGTHTVDIDGTDHLAVVTTVAPRG